MNYQLYVAPFFVALILSMIFSLAIIVYSKIRPPLKIRVGKRHINDKIISRFGGVAMVLSFLLTLYISNELIISRPLCGIIIGLALILFIGTLDDVRELSWQKQLFLQICAVGIAFFMGSRITFISNPLGGIILFQSSVALLIGMIITGAWAIMLMNAVNWIDGIDGVSGGITFIASISIFFLALKPEVNQPPVAIVAIALAGAILGFLFFNFNPARIFAGTSGSFGMGYIIAMLSIFAGTKIATTLLILAIPMIDACWVVIARIRSGESIFHADMSHLHHVLLKIGWSQKKISFVYWVFTALIAIIALNANAIEKIISFAIILCVASLFIFHMRNMANHEIIK